MFLRRHRRTKDGKPHSYWSLVETMRTPDGPRQRRLCYLGELNEPAQARWLKTIEVFNAQGESRQLKLFPSEVEPPEGDPAVARVRVNKVRLERPRRFGDCYLGWSCGGAWLSIISQKPCWTGPRIRPMCPGRGPQPCW